MKPLKVRPLSPEERIELERMAEGGEGFEASRRARAILLSASGYLATEIGLIVPMHANNVRKWIKRFNAEGIEGIKERRGGGRPKEYGPEVEEDVIRLVLEGKPGEGGVWTLGKLREAMGGRPSRSTIRRILQKRGLNGGRRGGSLSLKTLSLRLR